MSETKLSHERFFRRAIVRLRKEGYKGINPVFTGVNEAFRDYFGTDPIEASRSLVNDGKLVLVPCKRGVMLYLPEDPPVSKRNNSCKALAAILAEPY